jgi:lycopene cyclase domain-containing protein
VEQLAYLAVLAGIVLGSVWLEVVLRTNVLRRVRRLLLTLVPVVLVFLLWDAYAIDSGHWTFDVQRVTGLEVFADIPLEELLFFIVVPFASILTLEAVRSVRGWRAGDEPSTPAEDR